LAHADGAEPSPSSQRCGWPCQLSCRHASTSSRCSGCDHKSRSSLNAPRPTRRIAPTAQRTINVSNTVHLPPVILGRRLTGLLYVRCKFASVTGITPWARTWSLQFEAISDGPRWRYRPLLPADCISPEAGKQSRLRTTKQRITVSPRNY
jgi:hypothetical protein